MLAEMARKEAEREHKLMVQRQIMEQKDVQRQQSLEVQRQVQKQQA